MRLFHRPAKRALWSCGLVLVACCATGCIPLPFASPPVKVSGVIGGGGGTFEPVAGQVPVARSPEVVAGARVGVHPQGLLRSQLDRSFDLGLGYTFERILGPGLDAPALDGLYLQGDFYPVVMNAGENAVFRAGVVVEADLFWSRGRDAGPGFGASAGVTIEFAKFVVTGLSTLDDDRGEQAGSDAQRDGDADLLGVALGEVGIGASVVGGYRDVGFQQTWMVVFRLDVRLPASAGVLLIWP